MSMSSQSNFMPLKIIFVGDPFAGKTCLLSRMVDNQFNQNYMATIGVDFKIKTFEVRGRTVKAQLWDTAGQERFRSMTAPYYKNADAIMICYDMNNPQSFKTLSKWLAEAEMYVDSETPKVLVGCKKDLEMMVPTDSVLQYVSGMKSVLYFETSAKTGEGVEDAFKSIVEEAAFRKMSRQVEDMKKSSVQVAESNRPVPHKKGCC